MKNLVFALLGMALLLTGCEKLSPEEPGLLVPKTVDQDRSVPSILVNNTWLHSETFGDPANPMIVILHGGPGGDYRYLLNCKAFADNGYFVVFYDQRGSGLSRRENKSSYSSQTMVDDLTAVIAYYRSSTNQKIILLGQSWGAILATNYINQYPNAIHGAILSEPGGFLWKDIKEYVKRTRNYGFYSETVNDVANVDQYFTGKESEHEVLDYKYGLSAVSEAAADNPLGDFDHAPFWRMGAIVNRAMFDIGERDEPDLTTNLHSYNHKVLFVYSERNKAYGSEYAAHVSSAYPNVQLARIDGAGHKMITFPQGWNNFFPIAINYLNEIK